MENDCSASVLALTNGILTSFVFDSDHSPCLCGFYPSISSHRYFEASPFRHLNTIVATLKSIL